MKRRNVKTLLKPILKQSVKKQFDFISDFDGLINMKVKDSISEVYPLQTT